MATNGVGAANIRLGADISGFLQGIQRASAQVTNFTYQVNRNLADSFRRADAEARTFRAGLGRLGDDLQGIGAKMSALVSLPLALGAGKAYKEFANIEKLKIGLDQYGESMEKVKRLAALPNVSIEGAAESLIMLRSVRMESGMAERTIKAFANALTAAGKSSADLAPALVNIQQMMATGKINAVDIKEMSNRIPQARQLIADAFGTTDGDVLNKIGVDKVISTLVERLEKIPPVAGGAGMAMEKLQDTVQFTFAAFGESIEKNFNISGVLNKLSGWLEGLAEKFNGLSPGMQKAILVMGGLAAAIGPVLLAIGGLVSLWPVLATGAGVVVGALGAISAPIIAIGVAIAAAAAAVVYHWDSIKKALVDSGIWSTLKEMVGSTLGVIINLFKAGIAFIKGDWEGLGRALVNTLKSAANLIVESLSATIRAAMGLFAEFNRFLGMDALANGVNKGIDAVDRLAKKFKFDLPKSAENIKTVTDAVKGLGAAAGGGGGGGKGGGTADGVEDLGKAIEFVSSAQKEMQRINKLMEWQKEQEQLKSVTEEYKKMTGAVAGLNVERMKGAGMNFSAPDLGKLQGRSDSMLDTVMNLPGMTASIDQYEQQARRIADVNNSIVSAMDNAQASALAGMGEWIGGMITGAASLADLPRMFGSILGDLAQQIGKSMIAFGTAGEAIQKLIKNPMLAIVAGVGLVALGAALKANVQKSIDSKMSVPAFAKGGMVGSDMLARVGDNPNARFDNEIIAPYSKVDKSLRDSIKKYGGGSGPIEVIVRGEISGDKIRLVGERAARTRQTIG